MADTGVCVQTPVCLVIKHLTLLVVVVIAITCTAYSASQSDTNTTVQYPSALPLWSTRTALEVSMMKMPEDVVEEADTYRWPSVTCDFWLGLPANVLLNCRLTTQVINWHVQLGPRWQWSGLEPIGISLGTDLGYFVGGIGSGAFDNSNYSAFIYPNLAIGWRNEKLAVTIKSEINYCLAKVDRAGDIEVANTRNFANGGMVALYLEQPFWGTTNVELGFRYSYVKYAYQNWLLFPTISRYYGIPEVMIGVRL